MNLFNDFLVVLPGQISVGFTRSLDDLSATFSESFDLLSVAFLDELINLRLYSHQCFVFQLVTSEVCDHFLLAWDVELLLIFDHTPSLTHIDGHAINWDLQAIICS